jgi:glycosyltransferase involved in cell wall biosynthesis
MIYRISFLARWQLRLSGNRPAANPRPANMVRALHVAAALDPVYGGPSYTVPKLCEALAAAGSSIDLFSVARKEDAATEWLAGRFRHRRFSWDYARVPILQRLCCSSSLSRNLHTTAPNVDLIHDHGIWLLPNMRAGRAARAAQRPLIISLRGMLSRAALGFSPWKKRALWAMCQGPMVRRAACIHATSEQEYGEIRAFGLKNPVAVIPNGIDLPDPSVPSERSTAERVVLSLGRMHPKKGLESLLHAWANIEPKHSGWRLRIIGPAERGHDRELRALATALGLAQVSIEGPIYGDAKATAYETSDLFVLPTLNENFGNTVAEALASGVPVIASKGAPWSRLESEGCGWWIDHGVESISTALTQAMAMPRGELQAKGKKARAWMARDFSWDQVASDMLAVYHWLARRADAPSTVRFD